MPSRKRSIFIEWFLRSIDRAHSKGHKGVLGYIYFVFKFVWIINIDIIARHCPLTGMRELLYRSMGVKVGKGVFIDRDVYFDVVWPELISIGDGSSIALGSIILCHEYNLESYKVGDVLHNQHHIVKPIKLCDNVMIGSRAIILPGVTIGHGSVIGTGSTVNKDIPPWSIAVGNPARIVKTIGE